MRLATRFAIAAGLIAILPLAATLAYDATAVRNEFQQEALDQLESVAAIQRHRIEDALEHNGERMDLVASRTQMRISLANYLDSGHEEERERVERILVDAHASMPTFLALHILDPDGTLVASSGGAPHQAWLGPPPNEPVIDTIISGPLNLLHGALDLEGRILGSLLIIADVEALVDIVMEDAGLGRTGETVVTKDGLFLLPTRLDSHAALNRQAGPVATAGGVTHGRIVDALDYRDQEVLAFRSVLANGWTVLVKQDVHEAFAASDRALWLQATLLTGLAALVVVGVWGLSQRLAEPVTELTQDAREVAARHGLILRASNDEFADLKAAIRGMKAALQGQAQRLAAQVEAAREELARVRDGEQLEPTGT